MKNSERLLLIVALACGVVTPMLLDARQQGQGQVPSSLPLSHSLRERGSSVTPAFEGWYKTKDGGLALLVGYFNRNSKQEFDIPVGSNNRIEPGGPDMGQPTHFQPGRQWGIFSIRLPKDFGEKKLTWTIVANGFSNTITLHTKPDYVLEPFEDAANKNTPPSLRFEPNGPRFAGPPLGIAASYTATAGAPLVLTTWAADEPPKVNVPATFGPPVASGRGPTVPPAPMLKWSTFRGPAAVTFDPFNPKVDREKGGENTSKATFTAPGEYLLRLQANDSTGEGGAGFQCCWTNAHVRVTVKGASTQ